MYKIPKQLVCVLENERQVHKKLWNKKFPWYQRVLSTNINKESKQDTQHRRPKIYMLVGYGNTINNLIPLVSEGGCGVMPAISPNEFGRALCLIPEGSQFMGLARVGAFHTHNTPSMGYVKSELYRMNPDTVFLSVGRNGYLLERPVTKSQINRLKLKAV